MKSRERQKKRRKVKTEEWKKVKEMNKEQELSHLRMSGACCCSPALFIILSTFKKTDLSYRSTRSMAVRAVSAGPETLL